MIKKKLNNLIEKYKKQGYTFNKSRGLYNYNYSKIQDLINDGKKLNLNENYLWSKIKFIIYEDMREVYYNVTDLVKVVRYEYKKQNAHIGLSSSL